MVPTSTCTVAHAYSYSRETTGSQTRAGHTYNIEHKSGAGEAFFCNPVCTFAFLMCNLLSHRLGPQGRLFFSVYILLMLSVLIFKCCFQQSGMPSFVGMVQWDLFVFLGLLHFLAWWWCSGLIHSFLSLGCSPCGIVVSKHPPQATDIAFALFITTVREEKGLSFCQKCPTVLMGSHQNTHWCNTRGHVPAMPGLDSLMNLTKPIFHY